MRFLSTGIEVRTAGERDSSLYDHAHMIEGPAPGEKLGKYLIEAELGRGKTGVVFRARHAALGLTVAVKVVPCRLSVDAEGAARVRRAAQAITQLEHSNIVQVF